MGYMIFVWILCLCCEKRKHLYQGRTGVEKQKSRCVELTPHPRSNPTDPCLLWQRCMCRPSLASSCLASSGLITLDLTDLGMLWHWCVCQACCLCAKPIASSNLIPLILVWCKLKKLNFTHNFRVCLNLMQADRVSTYRPKSTWQVLG